jgi:hypothetical protein
MSAPFALARACLLFFFVFAGLNVLDPQWTQKSALDETSLLQSAQLISGTAHLHLNGIPARH